MSELNEIIAEQSAQGVKIESIEKVCDEIKTCLLGNGKPGLVLRTDRLEQRGVFQTRLFWIFATAVIALAVKDLSGNLIGAFIQASGGN